MLEKIFIVTAISFGVFLQANCQHKNVREEVYLHVNTPFLLTGETLYFSTFVNSESTGRPSPLSSILYVELVGENGKAVFQQKIGLDQGRGQGEYFVSSLVATGRYQLIAYTRWMKNFHNYFQMPVTIVNPFEEYQEPKRKTGVRPVVSFYPEGGALVAGQENVVVFRVTDAQGLPIESRGKIVAANGEQMADLVADESGVGRFSLLPDDGQSYQVILEDEHGEFYFYDLPEVEDRMILQLRRDRDVLRVTLTGTVSNEAVLEITDGQNVILSRQVFANSPVAIRTESMRPGVYRMVATDLTGKEVAERLFLYKSPSVVRREDIDRTFEKRSLVQVPIELAQSGTVSVSVRKVESHEAATSAVENSLLKHVAGVTRVGEANWQQADNLLLMATWRGGEVPEKVKLLPELRGELISGKISTETGGSIGQKIITYSISGENHQIQTAATDEGGRFQVMLEPLQGLHDAYIGVWDDKDAYTIQVDNPFLDEYPAFDYTPLGLDSAFVAALVKRSVRNQIENAYYELKKDSVRQKSDWLMQFSDFTAFYLLDDYNRFAEMHQHFIEYIPLVVARNNKRRSKIKVLLEYAVSEQGDPLILIDGVPASAEKILDFSPYKIESIGVINNRFFLGPLVADGVVSFHTFDKDLQGFAPGENTQKLDYQGLEPMKVYAFPEYEGEGQLDRIPDYRDQLYWQPRVEISSGRPYLLEFYTSDTDGEFEIAVEGYTEAGTPLSLRKYFRVADTSQPASN